MGKAVKTYVFTADEIRGLIDREAPERLGMSGSKFIEAYFNDSLPDSPAALELAMLVKLDENSIRSSVSSGVR